MSQKTTALNKNTHAIVEADNGKNIIYQKKCLLCFKAVICSCNITELKVNFFPKVKTVRVATMEKKYKLVVEICKNFY